MKHKDFMDIQVATSDTVQGFQVGDQIVIQTKVDGANASIRYDEDTDTVVSQSSRNILSPANTLRGMYEFSQTLDKEKVRDVLGERYILYGEWCSRHFVEYSSDAQNKFYCFDVYDMQNETYLPQKDVRDIVSRMGLLYVQTWYEGKFISWEHCKSFLNKSAYGEELQEGIVVKNMTRLLDENNRLPFYVKIVNQAFRETAKASHKKEGLSSEKQAEYDKYTDIVKTIVTLPRVRKILLKGVDEGIIPENWGTKDMGTIAKWIPKEVFADCLKEEAETVASVPEFIKFSSKISMNIVRDMLEEKTQYV